VGELWLSRESVERRKWYFENLDKVTEAIRRVLDKYFREYEIYLFGSVAEGDHTMASDIDILVVSSEMPEQVSKRSEIAVKIYEAIGLDAPVELHMVNPEEFQWYRRFMRKYVRLYP